jgi:hypothetical protein
MASNGPWIMVAWIIFKNHLLEVGLTRNGRPWYSECSQPLVYYNLSCVKTLMNKKSLK